MEVKLVKSDRGKILQISAAAISRCQAVISVIWKLRQLPKYMAAALADAPASAQFDPGNTGVCMGYDFHLRDGQLSLIEVNTNATGLAAFQDDEAVRKRIFSMFISEFKAFGEIDVPQRVAIVDVGPQQQHFYPEFQFYQQVLQKKGISVVICDPRELKLESDDRLSHQGQILDIIYLRLTDFYLNEPYSSTMRSAFLKHNVCVTPTPREFHLLANKMRLTLYCDTKKLENFGLSVDEAKHLADGVPKTWFIRDFSLEEWLEKRKNFVFKFVDKYGSKGVYLGSTVSRKKMELIYSENRVAQAYSPPGEVTDPETGALLKFDLRFIVYRDQTIGIVARVYEGQITNFRSPMSDIVPVITV